MKIALAHFRVGFTDGVSLEMEKWKKALEQLGHEVIYISGEAHLVDAFIIDALSIQTQMHKKLFHYCYESLDEMDEISLNRLILNQASVIESELLKIVDQEDIDLLIPNNIFSLGLHIPAAIAFMRVIKEKKIKVINHHHDFYWERSRYDHPTTKDVETYLHTLFPYKDVNIDHVVINKIGQQALLDKKGVKSRVVPNVFDFDQTGFEIDAYNRDLNDQLNINKQDIVFLQATRIEDRKAIELAIDVVNQVSKDVSQYVGMKNYRGTMITEQTNIHLLMPGLNELKDDKMNVLQRKIDQSNANIHMINHLISAKRHQSNNQKYYALWDMYAIADMITYPSILEGWGNQFLEGLCAKKPMVIYEYPVYKTDIKAFNFDVVSLGDEHQKADDGLIRVNQSVIKRASKELLDVFTSKEKYEKMVNGNYQIGRQFLSIKHLENLLNIIINNKL